MDNFDRWINCDWDEKNEDIIYPSERGCFWVVMDLKADSSQF